MQSVIRRGLSLAVAMLLLAACAARAQRPVPPAVRAELQRIAGNYPLLEVTVRRGAAADIVFEDSAYTPESSERGTWTFGPPVTAAEADGCPPEKVLGRRIARAFWRDLGRSAGVDTVTVLVQGVGAARFSRHGMMYYRDQLDGPWAGDAIATAGARDGGTMPRPVPGRRP